MINNEVLSVIRSRFSCRNFSSKSVEREKIETVLDAAKYAPNGGGAQAWHFTVITSEEGKQLLLKAAGTNPPPDFPDGPTWPFQADFCGAPVVIIISTATEGIRFPDVSATLAAENLMIAAASLGLATVWSSAFTKDVFRDKEACSVKNKLIPEGNQVIATIFLGYPETVPTEKAPRREGVETWL